MAQLRVKQSIFSTERPKINFQGKVLNTNLWITL